MKFAFLLFIAGLACSLPGRSASTPTPVPTLIATVDTRELEDQLATASANFQESGEISLTFTEQQITTYTAKELARHPDIPITEPQVSLQDGQMILTGKVKVGFLSSTARIVFEPTVQDGNLQVTTNSADFGSVPIPDSVLKQITDMVNNNLASFISIEGRSVSIESVEIANGEMTVTGKAR